MKKLFILFVLLVVGTGFVFASNTNATLNIESIVPGIFLVRFTEASGGGQLQEVTPTLTVTNVDSNDYGKFVDGPVNLNKSLEVLSLHAWEIEAAANPLVNSANSNYYISYDVVNHDGALFAEGVSTIPGGWFGNFGISIDNLLFHDNQTTGDYPYEGTYSGSIVFTISNGA